MRDQITGLPSDAATSCPASDVRARFENVTAMVTMARIEDVTMRNDSLPDAARDAATARYVNYCDDIVEAYGALIDDGLVVQHVSASVLQGDPAPMLVDVPTIPKRPWLRFPWRVDLSRGSWWVPVGIAAVLGGWIGLFNLIGVL